VHACERCNGGASKNDEYFRLILALSEEAGGHPVAMQARKKALGSLKNEQKLRFREAIGGSLRKVDRVTRGGVFLRAAIGFKVDYVRVHSVVERIVRGLFFHENRVRLPSEVAVQVVHFHPPAIRSEQVVKRVAAMAEEILSGGCRWLGDTAFVYAQHVFDQQQPQKTGWVVAFYQRLVFLALTKPKGPTEGRAE